MVRRGATKKSRGRGRLTHIRVPTSSYMVHCRMDGLDELSTTVDSTEAALGKVIRWMGVNGWTGNVGWKIRQGDVDYWRSISISEELTPMDITADIPGGFEAQGPNNGHVRIERIYMTMK